MTYNMNLMKFKYKRTDIESIELINILPESHRPIVGRIIWWDFFGHRLVKNRSTAFDHWLPYSPDPDVPWEDVVESLVKFGYPESLAIRKMRPKFKKPTKAELRKAANAN